MAVVIEIKKPIMNSLRPQGGVADYLPTTAFYKFRVKRQLKEIERIEKQNKAIRALREEGEQRLKELELSIWWSNLPKPDKEHAKTICLAQGYREAMKFIENVGMVRHRASRLSGIY